jgi:hypothetical protein
MDAMSETYFYYTIRAPTDCLSMGLYEDNENWGEERTRWKRCATFAEAADLANFEESTMRADECEANDGDEDVASECGCPKCIDKRRPRIVRHVVSVKGKR